MARTDNLSNFLTDVASSIKEKKGDTTPIKASDFDTEIANLPSGEGGYQVNGVEMNAYAKATLNKGDIVTAEMISGNSYNNIFGGNYYNVDGERTAIDKTVYVGTCRDNTVKYSMYNLSSMSVSATNLLVNDEPYTWTNSKIIHMHKIKGTDLYFVANANALLLYEYRFSPMGLSYLDDVNIDGTFYSDEWNSKIYELNNNEYIYIVGSKYCKFKVEDNKIVLINDTFTMINPNLTDEVAYKINYEKWNDRIVALTGEGYAWLFEITDNNDIIYLNEVRAINTSAGFMPSISHLKNNLFHVSMQTNNNGKGSPNDYFYQQIVDISNDTITNKLATASGVGSSYFSVTTVAEDETIIRYYCTGYGNNVTSKILYYKYDEVSNTIKSYGSTTGGFVTMRCQNYNDINSYVKLIRFSDYVGLSVGYTQNQSSSSSTYYYCNIKFHRVYGFVYSKVALSAVVINGGEANDPIKVVGTI